MEILTEDEGNITEKPWTVEAVNENFEQALKLFFRLCDRVNYSFEELVKMYETNDENLRYTQIEGGYNSPSGLGVLRVRISIPWKDPQTRFSIPMISDANGFYKPVFAEFYEEFLRAGLKVRRSG